MCPVVFADSRPLRRDFACYDSTSINFEPGTHLNMNSYSTLFGLRARATLAARNSLDSVPSYLVNVSNPEAGTALATLEFQVCTEPMVVLSTGLNISVALLCMDPQCALDFALAFGCTFEGSPQLYAIAVSGFVLLSLVLLATVLMAVYVRWIAKVARAPHSFWRSLVLTAVVVLLGVVYFALFFTQIKIDAYLDTLLPNPTYFRLERAALWIDRVGVILATGLYMLLLHEWMVVIHEAATAVRRGLVWSFVAFAVVSLALMAALEATAAQSFGLLECTSRGEAACREASARLDVAGAALMVASTCVVYGGGLAVSGLMVAYGLLLLRDHWQHGAGRLPMVRLTALAASVALLAAARMILALHLVCTTVFVYPGAYLDVGLSANFLSPSHVTFFYLFVYILADTVPAAIFLVLSFFSLLQFGPRPTDASMIEHSQPLLEAGADNHVPLQYDNI